MQNETVTGPVCWQQVLVHINEQVTVIAFKLDLLCITKSVKNNNLKKAYHVFEVELNSNF